MCFQYVIVCVCDIAVLYLSYTISILTLEDVSAEFETPKDRQRVWVHVTYTYRLLTTLMLFVLQNICQIGQVIII